MDATQRRQIEPDFNRASSLWAGGQASEALAILRGLNSRFPDEPTILLMLGNICFSTKDYASALPYWEQLVKLKPKYELGSRGLFFTLMRHERFEDALDEAHRFIKLCGLTEEYKRIMEELDSNSVFDRLSGRKPMAE